MYKLIFILFMAVPVLGFSQTDSNVVSVGNNKLAIDLFKQIYKSDKNMVFSPFSITSALAMTYGGAKNETEKVMAQTLYFAPNNDGFHKSFKDLTIRILANQEDQKLKLANRIWIQKTSKFKPEFINLTKEFYNAQAEKADFIDATECEKARKEINKWVEKQTENRIKDLIPQGAVNATTRMVLVNALYFLASWEVAFNTELNSESDFFVNTNTTEKTTFLNQTSQFKYFENDLLQAVEIPYKNGRSSMVLLLPKEKNGIDNLNKNLSYNALHQIFGGLKKERVVLSIPKFKMEADFDLKEAFVALGMQNPFTLEADFSAMTGNKDLAISKIIHKAFIEVNDKGTEAAAATAVVMMRKSLIINEDPEKVFNANHPFIFLIKENQFNTILFMGKVSNPKK